MKSYNDYSKFKFFIVIDSEYEYEQAENSDIEIFMVKKTNRTNEPTNQPTNRQADRQTGRQAVSQERKTKPTGSVNLNAEQSNAGRSNQESINLSSPNLKLVPNLPSEPATASPCALRLTGCLSLPGGVASQLSKAQWNGATEGVQCTVMAPCHPELWSGWK